MKFSWLLISNLLLFPSDALLPNVRTFSGAKNNGNVNGVGTLAKFDQPEKGDISPDGTTFLVADNHNIRQVIISTKSVSTFAGKGGSPGRINGIGTNARFRNPACITYSPDGTYALVTDSSNNLIRKIIISTALVTTIAGGGTRGTSPGRINDIGTNAMFNNPCAIAISPDGLTAVVADQNNNMIRTILQPLALVSTLAGQPEGGGKNGIGTFAKFKSPVGVEFFPDGTAILVADRANNQIRKIILSTAEVTTLVGRAKSGSTNGYGTSARFKYPYDIRISPDGLYALVADSSNHMIRIIILSTLFVDHFIGTGTRGKSYVLGMNAKLNRPRGVVITPNGASYLISDSANHAIPLVELLDHPTYAPTPYPTHTPSEAPTTTPTLAPTVKPSSSPTVFPTLAPTSKPSVNPTFIPTSNHSTHPPFSPTYTPSIIPTVNPTINQPLSCKCNITCDGNCRAWALGNCSDSNGTCITCQQGENNNPPTHTSYNPNSEIPAIVFSCIISAMVLVILAFNSNLSNSKKFVSLLIILPSIDFILDLLYSLTQEFYSYPIFVICLVFFFLPSGLSFLFELHRWQAHFYLYDSTLVRNIRAFLLKFDGDQPIPNLEIPPNLKIFCGWVYWGIVKTLQFICCVLSIILLTFLCSLWFCVGYILYQTKLLSMNSIRKGWLYLWGTPEDVQNVPRQEEHPVSPEINPDEYNKAVICHVILETLCQLIIQIMNNSLTNHFSNSVACLSLTSSILMILYGVWITVFPYKDENVIGRDAPGNFVGIGLDAQRVHIAEQIPAEIQRTNEELRNEITKLNNVIAEKETEISTRSTQIDELRLQVQNFLVQISELETDNTKKEVTIETLMTSGAGYVGTITRITTELESKTNEFLTLQEINSTLKKDLNEKIRVLEQTTKNLNEEERKFTESQKRLNEIESELGKCQNEVEKLRASVSELFPLKERNKTLQLTLRGKTSELKSRNVELGRFQRKQGIGLETPHVRFLNANDIPKNSHNNSTASVHDNNNQIEILSGIFSNQSNRDCPCKLKVFIRSVETDDQLDRLTREKNILEIIERRRDPNHNSSQFIVNWLYPNAFLSDDNIYFLNKLGDLTIPPQFQSQTNENKRKNMCGLVLESGGMNLREYLKKERVPISQQVHILQEIVEAVRFLHQKNIVHFDLKPENIVMFDSGDHTRWKLIDFDSSYDISSSPTLSPSLTDSDDVRFTKEFVCPEVFRSRSNTSVPAIPISSSMDIWSLGAIAFFLFTTRSFLNSFSLTITSFTQDEIQSVLSSALKYCDKERSFIWSCLQLDPADRWSATQLLEKTLFKTGKSTIQANSLKPALKESLEEIKYMMRLYRVEVPIEISEDLKDLQMNITALLERRDEDQT